MADEQISKQYAQISGGKVINIIVLEDDSLAPLFQEGFDLCVRVDELETKPQIGWDHDGEKFSFAAVPLKKQYKPDEYGALLCKQAISSNVAAGLKAEQRLSYIKALSPYAEMLKAGDLQGFIDVSDSIPVDGVVITAQKLLAFVAQVQFYLDGK